MRIQCPFCGEREASEFSYLGAAVPQPDRGSPNPEQEFFAAVYLRENVAGPHQELWYHASGCRSWVRVMRDTRSHEIASTELARRVVDP